MEAWTLGKYERPYLDVRAIRFEAESRELVVLAPRGEYVIECEGGVDARVAEQLESLRSEGAPLWSDVRGGREGEWRALLQEMDHLGLLRDAAKDDALSARLRDDERAIDAYVDAARAWTLAKGRDARAGLASAVAIVLAHVDALARDLDGDDEGPRAMRLDDVLVLDDFFVQTALLQASYAHRAAPGALAAGYALLVGVAGETGVAIPRGAGERARRLRDAHASGVYAREDARRYLDALATFLVESTKPTAARVFRATFTPKGARAGLDFVLDVERVAAEAAARVGAPRFLAAVSAPDAPIALAQGAYLEELRVTERFVEILTPLLSKRLAPPLRKRMFRYYAEEVGHEAFEYESCKSVGLTDERIAETPALPLHVAYVDLFTLVAEVDPIAFFASIFVTEGSLGTSSPLDEPLRRLTNQGEKYEELAGAHAALNEEYNHTSLSRLFLADVGRVSEVAQARAIAVVLLLMELNHRAWDALLDVYSARDPWNRATPTRAGAAGAPGAASS
jgi:hypothetical protein